MQFSVCIPHLNDYLALWFTVHSVQLDAAEDYGPDDFEIVVCDNNSRPEIKKKVDKLFADRVLWGKWRHRVVTWETQGVDQARTCAADNAESELLFFLDSHVLVNRGYFKTAVDYMKAHPEVGILHAGLSWNGYNKQVRGTAYKLKLDTDFWGDWVSHNTQATEPWQCGSSGLAAFAVRKHELQQVGGFNPHFLKYGGGEVYIDLKYWMFGYQVVVHPRLHAVHSGHHRDYQWDNGTLWVNFGICAYVIGGEEYLQKKLRASIEKEPHMRERFEHLAEIARARGEEERMWLLSNAEFTLPQVLEKFQAENIYY